MLNVLGALLGFNIYLYTRSSYPSSDQHLALAVIYGIFGAMWFGLMVFGQSSCTKCTPFIMEQIQHLVSELCTYPQLCASVALFSPDTITDPFHLSLLVLSSVMLLLVYVTRIVTVVKIRRYLSVIYKRMLFTVVGNYLIVVSWLALLWLYSPFLRTGNVHAQLIPQLTICGLVCITNIWNMLYFHSAHLYEFSLQSCFVTGNENVARYLIQLAPFNKNLYTLSVPLHGTLNYFWIVPFVAVSLIVELNPPQNPNSFAPPIYLVLLIAAGLTVIFNMKSLVLCLLLNGIVLCIVGFIGLIIFAAAFILAILFVFLALDGPLLILCIVFITCIPYAFCKSCSESNDQSDNEQ